MEIIKLHPDLITPKRGSEEAAGYDLFMPESGCANGDHRELLGLGFAAKVPAGHVALILPRSSAGVKLGVRLGNTVGVIDSDYEGEWKVNIRTVPGSFVEWEAGERLFQFVIVPISTPELQFVEKFSTSSERGEGGFGSTDALKFVYLPSRIATNPTQYSWQRFKFSHLTENGQGWYAESVGLSVEDRKNPKIFADLYEKWFGSHSI